MIESDSNNLHNLAALWIDCGDKDQYHIQYGSRLLVKRLADLEVEHHWEEFDGTHSGIDHRLDLSLPFLSKALN